MESAGEMVLDLDRVEQAAGRIPAPFVESPQYRSEQLSRLLGLDLFLKVETVSPTGTVASRGAEWWFECHPEAHRLVVANADDFGVAMAHAGRSRRVDVELFGPIDADPAKVEALRHAGTIVRLDGRDIDEARGEAVRYSGLVDALFVPIGRGSLAYGIGSWFHQRRPRVRVVGVGASRAPGTVHSVQQQRLVASPISPGLAPELSVSAPAERTVVPLSEALDDTTLVDDRHLRQAAAALLDHEGIRASSDGAAALAAAALAAPGLRGATVVVPVTGRIVS